MAIHAERTVDLSDLLEHSHAMLAQAEAGEWERVAENDLLRRQLIDRFLSAPSHHVDETEIRHCFQQMLQINGQLQQLAMQARDRVKAEVNTIGEGRKAVSAYAENSR